jgi:hypothetical protein
VGVDLDPILGAAMKLHGHRNDPNRAKRTWEGRGNWA